MWALLSFYVFVIGGCVGSFLNVVIHRYPLGQSIVFPRSRCPRCGGAIAWFDNIPILSFLLLLGRCRHCRNPISLRYPLIETATALFFLAIFWRTGPTLAGLVVGALVSMTIALIFIDADIQILPDVIDLPGVALGLVMSVVAAGETPLVTAAGFRESILGAAIGAGSLLTVSVAYRLIRGIEGMGLGDVKMLAMIGSVLGWRWLLTVLLLASVSGAITGLVLFIAKGKADLQFALPFGVFLGFAFLTVLFFGDYLVAWMPTLRLGF